MPIDMSAAAVKSPPRKRVSAVAPASVAPARTARELREEGLNGLGQLAQGVCLIAQQYADAGAIGQHFPGVASELAKLADSYESIAKPVDLLIQVGPFGALIAAGLPLVMQIAANHKLIDASKTIGGNVVPPEVLESQMKAQVARMQAEAAKQQQQAIMEARQAQAEYERLMREDYREAAA